MKAPISFTSIIKKFPGKGGWHYVEVPKKYTNSLMKKRPAWGMYPINAKVGKTSWKTKLMMKKGGSFFVAFKKEVREKEKIKVGERVRVLFIQ